jgi:hypothetical protein
MYILLPLVVRVTGTTGAVKELVFEMMSFTAARSFEASWSGS